MVAKVAREIFALSATVYPEPHRSTVLPREIRRLGDAFGLTQIGVSLITVLPGKQSSLLHHHSHEDELVYVLEGELVLHTGAGEEVLRPGMVVGYRAGAGEAHHMINRSGASATYLVVSNRHPDDGVEYPDEDLAVRKGPDGKYVATRKDGSPFAS
jgi:uncharacterized cupin superfamily protein